MEKVTEILVGVPTPKLCEQCVISNPAPFTDIVNGAAILADPADDNCLAMVIGPVCEA
jgi:hypothetical protein